MAALDGEKGHFEKVAGLYGCLDKVLKGLQLYAGRGVLVDRLLGELKGRADQALAEGAVTVRVTPIGLLFEDRPLSADGQPPRYVFRLFCDGVRELTLLPGVELEELAALAEVLGADPRRSDDDLVTLLWKRELKRIRYYAVDTLGMDLGAEGEITLTEGAGTQQLAQGSEGEEMVLSASDMRVLRAEDRLGWARECEAPAQASGRVAEAATKLRETFKSPRDYLRFVGIALKLAAGEGASPMVLGALDALVAQGEVEGLVELLSAIGRARRAGPAGEALCAATIAPERMERLAPLYNRHPEALIEPLRRLAGERDSAALVMLLKALPTGPAQERLLGVLAEAGVDMTAFYLKHLESPDPEPVIQAIAALGQIASPPAIKAISEALGHHLAAVRRAALETMKGHYNPDSRVSLGRVLRDPDRANRLLALEILVESEDRRLGGALLSALQDAGFSTKDEEEQMAFFRALVSFQDARTLAFLEGTLKQRNLGRSRAVIAQQMMAIEAIAAMRSEEARTVLERCGGSWLLPAEVRAAAQSALSGAR